VDRLGGKVIAMTKHRQKKRKDEDGASIADQASFLCAAIFEDG